MRRTVVSIVLMLFLATLGIAVGNVSALAPAQITQIAAKAHADFGNAVRVQKIPFAQAVLQQKEALVKQTGVRQVLQLKGGNLFVKFEDGNELLMLLGQNRLGSGTADGSAGQMLAANQIIQQPSPIIKQPLVAPDPSIFYVAPCAPRSNRALIYDCLEDDANAVSPKASQQVKTYLESLGYYVITLANNNANLATAALIDDGEYGVIFMRGHGGDLGGDFGFLVRPWYDSYPPANSGYTGTIRASAESYAGGAGVTKFGYVITGQFSSTYWANKSFPGSIFFLESCHGADPGALPGMPTWTINHGAAAWLGWNESVSFNCGDNGTPLFFNRMSLGWTIGQGVSAVYATGCRPPELVILPSGKEACKPGVWKADANEGVVPDPRDFKLLKLVSDGAKVHATITFQTAPVFDEFFFYASNLPTGAATVLVRVHPTNFEVYKPTSPGLYNNKVYTGGPIKSAGNYTMVIPWDTAFGAANPIYVWLYDMTGKDMLPDGGRVLLRK